MTIQEIVSQIKKCGYWEVVIKPEPRQYVKEKIKFDTLIDIVKTNQVRYRDLPFPHLAKGKYSGYYIKETYIESFTQSPYYLGAFRFYKSGQFVHYARMLEDIRGTTRSIFEQSDPPRDIHYLSPAACIFQLTEIFLFASRLATKGVLGDSANIQITLHNLNGRVLRHNDNEHFPFYDKYVCHSDKIECCCKKTPVELQAEHDDLAIQECIKILEQFNFLSKHIHKNLKSDQQDFYGRNS